MTKTFTENDLLRYAYGETSETENVEIENALVCDQGLQEAYSDLSNALSLLDNGMVQPGEASVQNIIEYSRSFNLPSVLK